MFAAVISKNGMPLMPTNIKKMRCLLKAGRARIAGHDPLTIRLTYDIEDPKVQPVELAMDTGYGDIGISVKSEQHEYLSEERKLLADEKNNHQKQKRCRRVRRSRLRYRRPMSKRKKCSRRKQKGWLAPSIKNKADRHVDRIKKYMRVFPIATVTLETGQFDTAVLAAVQEGRPIPQGTRYQHGPRYGWDTLREAVFARDKHKCKCCGKSSFKDDAILVIHHLGFRKGDRSNRMSNLAAVCAECHTAANHKPGGKLWNLKPKAGSMAPAVFMNQVKWYIYNQVCSFGAETRITYGAVTKRERLDRNMVKSHANDAYCIGRFRPKHRCRTRYFAKRRRNNRKLEKFFDAMYIDIRDGREKKASELGCSRTRRSMSRNNSDNLRPYRGRKTRKGYRQIKKKRSCCQSGSLVMYQGRKYICGGQNNKGKSVILKYYYKDNPKRQKAVSKQDVQICGIAGGWVEITKKQFYQRKKETRAGAA